MVQELLPAAIVSAVNYAEVITRLSLLGMPDNEIHQALDILGLTIIPLDEDISFRTGSLASVTKQYGLSLGDRPGRRGGGSGLHRRLSGHDHRRAAGCRHQESRERVQDTNIYRDKNHL